MNGEYIHIKTGMNGEYIHTYVHSLNGQKWSICNRCLKYTKAKGMRVRKYVGKSTKDV
jgi:hypothetical protein